MRRSVAALVVAVALSLTGCSSAPPPPAPTAAVAAAASPAPVAQRVSDANKLSPQEVASGAFPLSQQSPVIVADLVKRHQPMLVFFYDPGQPTTADERREVDAAMEQYRGIIDLVAFDVTSALPENVSKLKAQEKKNAQAVALLTQDLKIGFTPTIILVDKQGQISGRLRGYVDRTLLSREILKATQ